jgi:hypothetical protein
LRHVRRAYRGGKAAKAGQGALAPNFFQRRAAAHPNESKIIILWNRGISKGYKRKKFGTAIPQNFFGRTAEVRRPGYCQGGFPFRQCFCSLTAVEAIVQTAPLLRAREL